MNWGPDMSSTWDGKRDAVELQTDLRILHAKVGELFQIVQQVRKHFEVDQVLTTADTRQLAKNIDHMDEVYRWFADLKKPPAKPFD